MAGAYHSADGQHVLYREVDRLQRSLYFSAERTMALPALQDAPPFRTDDEGVVRIGETRVSLAEIVEAFTEGASAEEILLRYSSLNLPDIYSTIAYYLRHRAEVDAFLAEQRTLDRAVRSEAERFFDTQTLRERLLSRRSPT